MNIVNGKLLAAKWIFVLFFTVLMVSQLQAASSKGKEFFLSFQPNLNISSRTKNITLFISSEVDTAGVVEIPSLSFRESFQATRVGMTRIDLPFEISRLPKNEISNLSVKVTSNEEITVYGLNQSQYSTDAFLTLPVDALGTKYRVMSYFGRPGNYPSQVAITAAYDNTMISITPVTRASGQSESVADEKNSIILNSNQTYLLQPSLNNLDLTGTLIESSAPISVISGAVCSWVPVNASACDHLTEMIPSVSTWGKNFLTTPLATRKRGDLFRVLASQNQTEIRINGELVSTINAGDYYETILAKSSVINTSSPALVAQYSAGQSFDGVISDPFMMLVPPSEQFLKNYTFSALEESLGFVNNFVNVVAPTPDVKSIFLDGKLVDAGLFKPIGKSGYSGAQIPVSEGSHSIISTTPFGIYVYGFGRFDSYGYPGGMNFDLINSSGDQYQPNIKLVTMENVIEGVAGDSEDINLNNLLDSGEDLNANGIIDRRTEDLNNNGELDDGEDTNGDGILDRDTGIFRIELQDPQNLKLVLNNFIPGSLRAEFKIEVINPDLPSQGILLVTDGAGNKVSERITFSKEVLLQNVRVISTLSTSDIDLDETSFTQTPNSIDVQANKTVIEWAFPVISIGQIENLDYDIILKNPKPSERRLVTHNLELYFDDVNGKTVYRALGEQFVDVLPSVFNIAVATDRRDYTFNQSVQIDTELANLSQFDTTSSVEITIVDSNNNLVTTVGTIPSVALAANQTLKLDPSQFDVGNILLGNYIVRAALLNNKGEVEAQAETNFNIVAPTESLYAATVNTDKPRYAINEAVTIQDRVSNPAPNAIITGATAVTTITAPNGSEFWRAERALSDIAIQSFLEFFHNVSLNSAAPGAYTVSLSVLDANGKERVKNEKTIIVESTQDTGIGLTGQIIANPSAIYRTEATTLQIALNNNGNSAVSNLPASLAIVDIENQQVLKEWPLGNVSLAKGASQNFGQQWLANVDIGRQYAAILSVNIAGEARVLANQLLEVKEKILGEFKIGETPRLLVLADPIVDTCTANRSVTFEGRFDQTIDDYSEVYAKVFGEHLLFGIKDYELAAPADLMPGMPVKEINYYQGQPDLAITALNNERIQITLTAKKALIGKYQLLHYVSDYGWYPQLQSGLIDFECGSPLEVGQSLGALKVVAVDNVELVAANDDHFHHAYHPTPAEVPAMATQYEVLKNLLADRAYTLVSSTKDFKKELLSGQYQQYLLLSERQALDHLTAKYLREAVNRGEGLVFASGSLPKTNPLWEATGIVSSSAHYAQWYPWGSHEYDHYSVNQYLQLHADGISLVESPIATAEDVYFGLKRKLPFFELGEATLVASLINASYFSDHHYDLNKLLCYHNPLPETVPALAKAQYGKGKTVFIGYDILAEATHLGLGVAINQHAAILQNSLRYTTPLALPKRLNGAIPAQLNLENLGSDAAIKVTMLWPQESQIIDAVPAAVQSQELLTWVLNLSTNKPLSVTSWAIPTYVNGNAKVIAEVFLGELVNTTQVPYKIFELTITASPSESLPAVKQTLIELIHAEHNWHHKIQLKKALYWLNKAEYYYGKNNTSKALRKLLYSVNHIKNVDKPSAAALRLRVDELLWQWGQTFSKNTQ